MKESILYALGDIAFFNSIYVRMQRYDVNYLFSEVKGTLNRADIIFGNFEFPFTKNGIPFSHYSHKGYQADLSLLPNLARVNFLVLNLANNHIMDWGLEGLNTTKDTLNSLGIMTIGAGENFEEARRPVIIQKKGVKFGFLGYTKSGDWIATKTAPGAAKIDIGAIEKDITSLKKFVDHVIVSLHWGVEFSDYPYPGDIKIAHKIINMGASVILGHHPHVIQGYEKYHNGLIFYSLGNFIYDPYSEKVFVDTAINKRLECIIVEINFSKSRIVSFSIKPTKINSDKLLPVILIGKEKERLLKRLQLLSKDITDKGKEFYESALANIFERELKTYKLMFREEGWKFIWSRVRILKIRHIKLLLGFLISKIKKRKMN